MKKLSLKKKEEIAKEWVKNHGAASFDLEKRDIILHDGGLFVIEAKKIKLRKIIGYKRYPNRISEVLFSKKKIISSVEYTAVIWFEELDETIAYFKNMKRMLNKLGYNTGKKRKGGRN